MRYFLIGFMGSGKTYWGEKWSEAIGLKHYDLDEEIEKREGKNVTAIFEAKGEEAFRKIEKEVLHSLLKLDNYILSCGGGTPCFHKNMKQMNSEGVTVYLKSSAAELAQRLQKEKETRPLIVDVNNEVLEEFIAEKLAQREGFYAKAMYHLPAQHLSLENFEKITRRHGK
jgi:shikimate kinase